MIIVSVVVKHLLWRSLSKCLSFFFKVLKWKKIGVYPYIFSVSGSFFFFLHMAQFFVLWCKLIDSGNVVQLRKKFTKEVRAKVTMTFFL